MNTIKNRVVVSVISDLVTDQRVHKICNSLTQLGYSVMLIGAKRKTSLQLPERDYKTIRINLLFQKGFLMYAEWNLRLFVKLFFYKINILLANDLDTLLPNYLHSKLRGKKLVYDSHEYFTEQAEIQGRRFVKKTWSKLEQFIFPRLKNVYTVNESIATIYRQQYNVPVKVIRNVPVQNLSNTPTYNVNENFSRIPKILIVQGSGLNHDRGLEELVAAMNLLPSHFQLYIIGRGLVVNTLKKIASQFQTTERIHFYNIMPSDQLKEITRKAFCGFSLDKNTCLNHYYSLPNKLFDYIAAAIPVIASNLPEVKKVIDQNNIGFVIDTVTPNNIANAVLQLEKDEKRYLLYRQNAVKAASLYHWQNEVLVLKEVFDTLQ